MFHAHGKLKRRWLALLLSDKIDFKLKTITKDKVIL